MKSSVLLLFAALVACFKTGLCIECHQCASWNDGDTAECIDYYEADTMDECGDRDTHCLKIKMVNKLYDSGFILGDPKVSVTVSRGCIRADGYGDGCHGTETGAGIMIRCLCSQDGCNPASRNIPSVVATILLGMVAWIVNHSFRRVW